MKERDCGEVLSVQEVDPIWDTLVRALPRTAADAWRRAAQYDAAVADLDMAIALGSQARPLPRAPRASLYCMQAALSLPRIPTAAPRRAVPTAA
jgi:hypothetical protein